MSSAQNEFRRENEGRDWGSEFSPNQKSEYAQGMQAYRRSFGLTDGLRCSQGEFSDYLARRRAEDERARTGRRNPIHPSALAMYADGNDPREGSGVVSAGGM